VIAIAKGRKAARRLTAKRVGKRWGVDRKEMLVKGVSTAIRYGGGALPQVLPFYGQVNCFEGVAIQAQC
jgi:hypothetical protein